MTEHNRPLFEGISTHPMGITSVFQEKPTKYMMLLSFAQEILREEGSLSSADREVIAAYTSKLNGCEYCC
jgi:alkylhydroperoxidase family enzyme